MIGNVRNLYKVLTESRNSARQRATLAVIGDSPEAAELASVLGAQRDTRSAEVVVCVLGRGESVPGGVEPVVTVSIGSGPGDVILAGATEEAVQRDLIPELLDEVDDDYLVPLGLGYEALRRPVCEKLTFNNAKQNAVIGALPIPGADMPAIMGNQARMVLSIAAVHGEELSLERARELGGVLAAGLGMRALARQVVKVIPFGGWAASSAIAFTGTLVMGRATLLYFERGKRQPGDNDVEKIKQQAEEDARRYQREQ